MEGNINFEDYILKFYTDGEENMTNIRIYTLDRDMILSDEQIVEIFELHKARIHSIKFHSAEITLLKNSHIFTFNTHTKMNINNLMKKAIESQPNTFSDHDEALFFLNTYRSTVSLGEQ